MHPQVSSYVPGQFEIKKYEYKRNQVVQKLSMQEYIYSLAIVNRMGKQRGKLSQVTIKRLQDKEERKKTFLVNRGETIISDPATRDMIQEMQLDLNELFKHFQ